jgi:hypothetical protein
MWSRHALADSLRALIARVVASGTARRRLAAALAALRLRGRHGERASVAWALAQSYNGRKKAAAALLRWRWRHAERQQRAASIAAVWFGTPAGVATPPSPSFSAPVPFLRTLEEWASPPPHRHATPPTRLSAAFSAVAPGDRRARRQMLLRRTPRERALATAVRRWSVDSHDIGRLAGATTRRARLLRYAFDELGAAAAAAALARRIARRWLRFEVHSSLVAWLAFAAARAGALNRLRRAVARWHRAEAVVALGALRRNADDAAMLRHASVHYRKHALGAAIARWRLILKLRFAAVAVAATRDDAAGAASAVASLRSGFFPWRLLSSIRSQLAHLRRASGTRAMRRAVDLWVAWHARRRQLPPVASAAEVRLGDALRRWSRRRMGLLAVAALLGRSNGLRTSTALRRWQIACYAAFRARTLVARAVALWRQLDVARAMSSWRQRAAVHRRTRTALSRHLKLDVRRAVAHWAGTARRHTGLRRSATRVALAGGVRSLHDALNAWLTAAAARRRAIFVAARGAAALRQRGERSGFSALLEASVVHRRALLQLSRSAAALVNNLLRAAMNSWLEGTISRLHATSTLGRAVEALRQRGLRRALNGWLEAARRHWTRVGLAQAAATLAARATLRAFRRWRKVAPIIQLCFNAVAAVSHHETRRAMNAWLAAAASRAAAVSLLRRAVAAMHHRTSLAALNSWADAAAGRRAARQLTREGEAAFRRRGLRAALGAWLLTAARRAILTSKARRVVAAVMARDERAALHIWATRTFKRRVSLGQLGRAAAALVHRGRRAAWNSWAATSARWSALRQVMLLGVASAEMRATRRALAAWHRATERGVLLRRVAAAMVHRALRRALNSWTDGAADRRAARAINDSGAAGRLLLALRRWFLGVAAIARARATLRLGGDLGTAIRRLTLLRRWRRAARRQRTRSLLEARADLEYFREPRRRALRQLKAAAEEATSVETIILQRRLRIFRLTRGLRNWHARARGWRVGSAFLRRVTRGRVRQALARWCDAARVQRLMSSAATAMRSRGTRAALNTWALSVTTRTWELTRMRAAGAAFGARLLRAACNTWMSHVLLRMAIARRLEAAMYVLAPAWRAARRALTTWLLAATHGAQLRRAGNVLLSHKFNTWAAVAATAARRRAIVTTMLSDGGHGRRRAFNSWVASQPSWERRRRAAMALRHRGLFRAFASWAAAAGERRAQANRLAAVIHALSAEGRATRRAFRRWAAARFEGLLAEHAALVMLNHEVHACFVTWCASTAARLAALAVLGRAVAALRQRGLRRALNGWLEAAHAHWRRVGLLRSAVSPELRAARRALNCWRDAAATWAVMRRAAAALSRREQRAALNTWLAAAAAHAGAVSQLAQVVAALRLRGTRRAFNSWSVAAAARTEALRRLAYAATALSIDGRRCRRALVAWMEAAAASATALLRLRRAVAAIARRELRAAVYTWSNVAGMRRVALAGARRAAAAIARRGERAAFALLAFNAFARRRVRAATARWQRLDVTHVVHRWRELAVAARGRALVGTAAARRWVLLDLRRRMRRWAAVVWRRSALRPIMQRRAQRSLAEGLHGWRESARQRATRRALFAPAECAVGVMSARRAARRAFAALADAAAERHDARGAAAFAEGVLGRRRTRRAWRAWAARDADGGEGAADAARPALLRRGLRRWAEVCGERATLRAAARLGGTAGCARAWACWLAAAARATAAARLDERAAACARRLALEMALLRLGRHTLARTARRRVDLRAATSLCGGAVKRWRASNADRARDDVAARYWRMRSEVGALASLSDHARRRQRLAAAGWAPAMEVWV